MELKETSRQLKQVKSYHGDMFKTRKPMTLDTIRGYNSSPLLSAERSFEIVGHRHTGEIVDRGIHQSKVIPPISSQRNIGSTGGTIRPGSEPWRAKDHEQLLVKAVDQQQFLQTHGYIPGIDSQVTIKHPYVMKNGLKPIIINAFQDDKVLGHEAKTEHDSKGENIDDNDSFNDLKSVSVDTDYDIETFPPVGKDDIVKHAKLNKEAEKRSKNKPHAYEEFLRKLKATQRRLLERPHRETRKIVRRKTKKLLIKSQRETKADLFDPKPETPPPKPAITPEELRGPMKVIQSFRYSHALTEYYKCQMDSKHSISSFGDDTIAFDGSEELVNGWLVKTLGPQVLNMHARSIPSCNPIELRIRQQQARKRAAEHAKLSKRLSNMSRSGSRKQFRSRNSFTESFAGHESVDSTRSDNSELHTESSQSTNSKTKGARFLPNIPEMFIEEGFRKPDNSSRKISNSGKTKLVLTLPILSTDV